MLVMRVLMIGGTQFMGRAIVMRLLARGHDVTVLHRSGQNDLGPKVGNLKADRGELPAVSALVAAGRFEAVFDLAYDWQHGTTADDVEAVARSCGSLHRYVFMSSIAAYPPGLNHRESDPLAPDDSSDAYSANKAAAERRLFRMHEESGFPVTTFRPPFVHGPGRPFYREQFFWDRLLDGRPIILPDAGTRSMPWAFVYDVADYCVRALEVPEAAGEAFNVGHVEPTTQRAFLELLARVAGVRPTFVSVPREKIQAAGGQVMGANLYFGEVLDLAPYSELIDKAPRVLGIMPRPLEQALSIGFDWYQMQPRRPVDYTFEDRLLA